MGASYANHEKNHGISDDLYREKVGFATGYGFNPRLTCQLINNPSLSFDNAYNFKN